MLVARGAGRKGRMFYLTNIKFHLCEVSDFCRPAVYITQGLCLTTLCSLLKISKGRIS